MTDPVFLVMIAGALLVSASLARRLCQVLGIQPLVGFIALGLALSAAHKSFGIDIGAMQIYLEFLGQLGVIVLLFKVGLESDIIGLLAQLRRALRIWVGNVVIPAFVGFGLVLWGLDMGLVPAMFAGAALSATSIGVTTAIWQQANRLDSDEGELMLDVAELDDISAILLLAIVVSIAPFLIDGQVDGLASLIATNLASMLLKLSLLIGACYLFARHAEQRFTGWFMSFGKAPVTAALATTGVACIIAGFAEWIGFSIAIGALLAGLAFSRDPAEFEIDVQLTPIFELLTPFFFIAIGFSFDLANLGHAAGVGALLLVAGVLGKVIGAGVPAGLMLGPQTGLVIGVSMVPRAEIAMIIMLQGSRFGEQYVPGVLFDAMNIVVLGTALLVPLVLPRLLKRLPAPQ